MIAVKSQGAQSRCRGPIWCEPVPFGVQGLESPGKEVFVEMFQTGLMPDLIVERKGLSQSDDISEIESLCRQAISGNVKAVSQYKEGNEKALNALKGPVMKATKGKANPKILDQILKKLIDAQ